MRRRFFWSLLGAVAATLLIVTVLGALVTLSAVRAQSRDEMRRQVIQISEIVQDALISDGVDLAAADVRDVLAEPAVPTVRRVLLEAGRVVQEGTLAEITRRPRSPWSARLVGTNLYRGRSVADARSRTEARRRDSRERGTETSGRAMERAGTERA